MFPVLKLKRSKINENIKVEIRFRLTLIPNYPISSTSSSKEKFQPLSGCLSCYFWF